MSEPSSEQACQAEACELQACLTRNTYSPDKCDVCLRKLYKCCQSMYERTEGTGESTACPKPSVVRRWLKNHGANVT
ncbi:uncharacterized protein LAESUDRAFT_682572 [Laetiporus sulphureus 93-53]|uniref:Cx9C motif-containing protein 4, mitochondrial n=1 Tax=Laetiporus sulphureus 93-53 TaxID=1314785 RepID=A0A165DEC7_9APHY|nr:uncharacterized protein LAESUDRAFT_682572 [Laetiporus sulphureus 93-53]KZT04696.1 hypothetical protein LAESUDRAFT_682572 [Laetiporus sulphureus 93-53]